MHITTMTVVSVGDPTGYGVLCSPAGCVQVAALIKSVLVGLSGLLGVLGALSYLAGASDAIADERERVRAERDAFAAFADRVTELATSAAPTAGRQPVGLKSAPNAPVDAVDEAYRETVLALDHYETDYGEPLSVNLRAELGPDVADAVEMGGELTPDLQRGIVVAAEQARTEREAFLTELGTEADAISESTDRLRSVESALAELRDAPSIEPFDRLAERWRRLERLERACEEIVADRRASLCDRGAFDLARYLYEPTGTPFPVVAGAADVAGDVRETRRHTTDMLTRVI